MPWRLTFFGNQRRLDPRRELMTRATHYVQHYRLALRDLWNYHMRLPQFPPDGDTARAFDTLRVPLFEALVTRQLEPLAEPIGSIFGDAFRIEARYPGGPQSLQLLDAEGQPAGSVDGPFERNELVLVPLDLFDWDNPGWRDFRYYLVRVDRYGRQHHLAGREALVDVAEVEVLFNAGA
jgi:hypothetical protein